MPKGDFKKATESIVPLRGVVRNGRLAAILDQDGIELGMPVTSLENEVTGGNDFLGGNSTLKLPAGVTDLSAGVVGGSSIGVITGLVFDSKPAAIANIAAISTQIIAGKLVGINEFVIQTGGAVLWIADSIKMPSNTTLTCPDTLVIKGTGNSMEMWVDASTVALDGNGGIASVTLPATKPGNFTLGQPTCFVGGAFFEPAEIWAYADGTSQTFVDVYIANPGRGYVSAPTLSFYAAPNSQGVGAQQRKPQFTATVANGSVTAVTITDAGLKYPYKGWYPIRAKGGLHARMTANIDGAGVAQSITVNTPGLDYNDVPLSNLKFHMIGGNKNALFPLVTNADWFNGNEHIKVVGGIWDGNVDEVNPAFHYDEFAGMCFLFISCDHTVAHPRKIQNCTRYGFHFFDCWNTKVLEHDVSNGFDDVHLTGANRHATVSGVFGATGDDFTTATALERPVMDFYAGDIRHLTCDNYHLNGSMFALACWSGQRPDGTSYKITDINFNRISGLENGRLMRLGTVDTAMNNAAIGHVSITMANMQWPDSFVGSAQRDPGYGPMIQATEVIVDTITIKDFSISNNSATSVVTPQVLDVGANAIVKALHLSNFSATFACAPSQELFNFASAGGPPSEVRITGNSRIEFGSTATTSKYAFQFGINKPTKLFDIGNTHIEHIGVASSSTFTAGDWNITSAGAYLYQNHATAIGFSYAGVVKYSCVGTQWLGTQRAFAAASASDNIDYLHWTGSGNTVTCTVHESNSRGRLYPRDYSLSLSITHQTNNNRIAKLDGCYFYNYAASYGLKPGPLKCGQLIDGTLAWRHEINGGIPITAVQVAGGAGYAANDYINVATASPYIGVAPISLKVTTVNAGAITGLSADFATFVRMPAAASATTAASGAGAGATVTVSVV